MKRDEKEKTLGKKAAKEQITEGRTAEKQSTGKTVLEMNLLDDFLFGSVVTYPEIGKEFVRKLLRIIFGRDFKHLSVSAQKVFYGADSDLHGARLDVYMEPETGEDSAGTATVYDVEPDCNGSAADRKALPRRVRFYHGKIAVGNLMAGRGYDELKNAVIIMIVPYDPFGLRRMVYTVKNACVEEPEMKYEDGASTLFLYTKGTKGASNEALKQLLHYMEETSYENAVNDDLRRIHEMVETVRKDPETSIRYLRLLEKLNRSRREGELEGEVRGKALNLISLVCKKMKKNKPLEVIAEELEEEISTVEPIYNAAREFAPEYDPEKIFERMNGIDDSIVEDQAIIDMSV